MVLLKRISQLDLLCLLALCLGFIAVILVISPARSFPIVDDWIYGRVVQDSLNWNYHKADWSQAIGLSHIAWGTAFAALFGFSFTTLALANLVMSLCCLLAFYFLLRQLTIPALWALFGVAVLGFNPIYFYLSYTFMTDITFVTFILLACIGYIHGIQTGRLPSLLLAGTCTGLAYLTRQFALVIVLSALFCLWWSSRWTWTRAISIIAVPVAIFIGYGIWDSIQPSTLVDIFNKSMLQYIVAAPLDVLADRTQRIVSALSVWGITLAPLLVKPKRLLLSIPILLILVIVLLFTASAFGTVLPHDGSIVDYTGFLLLEYPGQGLWPQPVWTIIAVIGIVAISLYFVTGIEWLYDWLRFSRNSRRHNVTVDPQLFLTLTGLLLAGGVIVVPAFFFDRYLLPSVALLMPMVLKQLSRISETQNGTAGQIRLQKRWLIMIPLSIITLCGFSDYMVHMRTKWQAAEALAAEGVPRNRISVGFEWAGLYLYEEGAQLIREGAPFQFPGSVTLDPRYLVADFPQDGWVESARVPYTSLLTGGETRNVLIFTKK